jgi:glyoxylase-like metal-dependent hydrolase (beta-lactamase superfamily II)
MDQQITVEELRGMLERGEPVTVLDVRRATDRAEWFIPGSVFLDVHDALWTNDFSALSRFKPPAGQPVVTVCGRGNTSMLAMAHLRERGIPAASLHGGMRAWSLAWNSAQVPVPGSAAETLQVRRAGKGCLSYLTGSRGQAAVIDPSLDPQVYADLAFRHGWTISAVLDTHVHADHLTRGRQLAELTGARLYLPEQKRVKYPFLPLEEGDELRVGDARLTVLATPGHTRESICYFLDGKALFTGDTLFTNAVGRPDLATKADEETRQRARLLYASLQRLRGLPSGTLVLPGHTSEPPPFDGKPLAATLADAIARAGVLQLPEEKFVEAVLARIPPPPANHLQIVTLNEHGTAVSDSTELEAGANRCALK